MNTIPVRAGEGGKQAGFLTTDPGGGTLVTEIMAATMECVAERESYARFEVEPLQSGFATTLGNAMRRVLLSSLPGAAVTWVMIEGVQHEFSTIPNAEEDVTELLLNIKEIRLRAFADRPGTLNLEVMGEGEVTAADIEPSADYEVVNPELHLATLGSPEARLSMELHVERGTGYVPVEQSDGLAIGVIPVDAIFTPVRRVNYSVDRTRVGQMTNFERLALEVWTDGSIAPAEAVRQSAQILTEQLAIFVQLGRKAPTMGEKPSLVGVSITEEEYETPIERLELTVRAFNCLKRSGISKVGEVLQMTEEELLGVKNFGQKSLDELKERLGALGHILRGQKMEPPQDEPTPEVEKEAAGAAVLAMSPPETGEGLAERTEEEAAEVEGEMPKRLASLQELARVFGVGEEDGLEGEEDSISEGDEVADET